MPRSSAVERRRGVHRLSLRIDGFRDQRCRIDSQRIGELADGLQRRIRLPALGLGGEVLVEASELRELLLGKAGLEAQAPQSISKFSFAIPVLCHGEIERLAIVADHLIYQVNPRGTSFVIGL